MKGSPSALLLGAELVRCADALFSGRSTEDQIRVELARLAGATQAALPGVDAPPAADAWKEAALRIFTHWQKATGHKRAILSPERTSKIRARLREFSEAELCRAIDGCAASEWHSKEGANEITLILRDVVHVEKFLKIADEKVGVRRTVTKSAEEERIESLKAEAQRALKNGNPSEYNRIIKHIRSST